MANLPPLRACLLSGGESRRMGSDKALLTHPAGGTWLEQTLRRLIELEALLELETALPVTVFSRHRAHRELSQHLAKQLRQEQLAEQGWPAISAIEEPAPREGPLLALHRLMERYPEQRLLLCPVDMPGLSSDCLRMLLNEAASRPATIHLSHDGDRLQPLLGLYPSTAFHRSHLAAAIDRGERRLQSWLEDLPFKPVMLDPRAIRNVNRMG